MVSGPGITLRKIDEAETFFLVVFCFTPHSTFLVTLGRFLGWTNTKQRITCVSQGDNKVPPMRLEPAIIDPKIC